MPPENRVIVCVAKETRSAKTVCGIVLVKGQYGGYGHVDHTKFRHWPHPKAIQAAAR